MKKLKIEVVKKTEYKDLMDKYENPIEHPCDVKIGQIFYVEDLKKPDGLCESAWQTIYPFAMTLAYVLVRNDSQWL